MMKILNLIILLLLSNSVLSQKKNKKNIYPHSTSAEQRLKGYNDRLNLNSKSIVKNISFRNIGPTVMSGRVVDLDINQIINFNCDEYFPVDNTYSAANGTYFLSTLWLLSSTCDYIIDAQTFSVEQKCKAESSEEFIDVENIFIPNKELQLYLQNIRLDLKR